MTFATHLGICCLTDCFKQILVCVAKQSIIENSELQLRQTGGITYKFRTHLINSSTSNKMFTLILSKVISKCHKGHQRVKAFLFQLNTISFTRKMPFRTTSNVIMWQTDDLHYTAESV